MGHLAIWKVLEQMVTDLRKKGVNIPPEIIGDLKNAKTTITIFRDAPECTENVRKIEEYLGNVESYLVSEAQKKLGPKYVEKWLTKVEEAGRTRLEEEKRKFIPGLPRQQKWIRITPSPELSIEKLKVLAEELCLSFKAQIDGNLLVYGEDDSVKNFVKKVAEEYKLRVEK
jgi:hypothetical protein